MMLLIFIVFCAITIVFFKRKNKYWYYKGVDFPNPMILFGNMYDVITNKISRGQYYNKLYKIYKSKGLDYFGFYTFITPVLVVINPNLIQLILQSDFKYFQDRIHYVNEKNEPTSAHLFRLNGAKWKQLRAKLTPTFTSGKMKMMFNTLLDCSIGLKEVINKSIDTKELLNIKNVTLRYTTDVIVSCAFGVDCNTLVNPDSEFIKYANMIVKSGEYSEFKEFFSQSFPRIADLVKLKLIPKEVKTFLTSLVTDIIKKRETNNIQRRDFMDLLIKLKNNTRNFEDNNVNRILNNDISLTIDEIIAQVYIFFLAGYETSATTLLFCFYELSLNRDVQEKLRNEVQSTLKKYDGEITYEGLKKMTYMDMVVKETLRKYPPVLSLNRKCIKTYKVPESNLTIEKGTNILIPVLSIQADEDYYPNPSIFDPERFNSKLPSCTWLAFGEGPRNCIGLRFGLMQVKVALASLLNEYQFTVDAKNTISLGSVGVFLAPKEDILLRASKC